MRRTFLIFLFLSIFFQQAFAQTTKVLGHVIDGYTGEPLPFCSIWFKDSGTGVSTGEDGSFSLTTRDASKTVVCAHIIGYRQEELIVKPGVFTELMFFMIPQENRLSEVVVKADDSKARRLLANIDANRSRNSPETRSDYECDVYSRMELDLTNPVEQLQGKAVKKNWGFIFEYVDTSEVSGVQYLPVMISEAVSRRRHSLSSGTDKEEITASRISGADPSGNLLTQFTGSLHLRNNFYKPFVNTFNVDIPSPLSGNGLLYYDYFIVDSLSMEGRNSYRVRFHPKKNISSPAFDGEMYIDTGTWALRRIRASLTRGQNMNWVRDMVLESEFRMVDDSTWFYKSDKFYADFSIVAAADSSRLISLIGRRSLEFSRPDYSPVEMDKRKMMVTMTEDAGCRSEEYWDSVRPYALSEKEKNIYDMVGRVKETDMYKTMYDVVSMILNGYYDVGKIGFGEVLRFVSYNKLEGHRFRFGMHTSPEFSKKHRLTGYVAYGLKDRQIKGGGSWEYLISKEPTRKLTVDAHYDVLQLGRGESIFKDGNFLSSILGGGQSQRPLAVTEASLLYEHEFTGGFNTAWQTMFREYHPNPLVPMLDAVSGEPVKSMYSATADVQLRFSRDETVTRGFFIKTYIESPYPVFSLDLLGGVSGLNMSRGGVTGGCHPFFRPEFSMDWKARIPPVGVSEIRLKLGTVIGRVPYPLLYLHEGNGTFLLEKYSFATMDFFEFASDSWATLMIDHNFNGFFLGKIPYVKKLQLREVFILKATWGCLSRRNDGRVLENGDGTVTLANPDAVPMMCFPEGMKTFGKVPYVECGFGITNIFRLLRVDFIWRCTHRDEYRPRQRNFVVNVGLELKF